MQTIDAQVLFRPDSDELRFLPEGPYPLESGRISWVAIQHGPNAASGSLNLLTLDGADNRTIDLDGRPGFAFPTQNEDVFVVGLERQIQAVNIRTGASQALSEELETGVQGTIINDAAAFAEGIVLGCKDLEFDDQKAGLYLWRSSDHSVVKLHPKQTCSNGKVIQATDDGWTLLNIDTPTTTVVRYPLDVAAGRLGDVEVVLDAESLFPDGPSMFPDGMVETPDHKSVIIAFYNPEDAAYGVARQYSLETKKVEAEWRCAASPQVTCPQLIQRGDAVRLILTTAVEHMTQERQQKHVNAGALFEAETVFKETPPTPIVELEIGNI